MNGYNFSERVRRVLAFAREESLKLNHEYVGTEHILLSIIRDDDGVAVNTLRNLNVNLARLRERVIALVPHGRSTRTEQGEHGRHLGPDLPYTSRAKKVLELSMAEARDLNHSYVGTEHLLLGLIREERGIGAQMLLKAGVDHDVARSEILRLLGGRVEMVTKVPEWWSTPQVQHFMSVATRFNSLIKSAHQLDQHTLLHRVHLILPRLYSASLDLPKPVPSDDEAERSGAGGTAHTDAGSQDGESTHLMGAEQRKMLVAQLGPQFERYREVVDGFAAPAAEPAIASLSDNLIDIHNDLSRGFARWSLSAAEEAVGYWRNSFEARTSEHITSALRAIRTLSASYGLEFPGDDVQRL